MLNMIFWILNIKQSNSLLALAMALTLVLTIANWLYVHKSNTNKLYEVKVNPCPPCLAWCMWKEKDRKVVLFVRHHIQWGNAYIKDLLQDLQLLKSTTTPWMMKGYTEIRNQDKDSYTNSILFSLRNFDTDSCDDENCDDLKWLIMILNWWCWWSTLRRAKSLSSATLTSPIFILTSPPDSWQKISFNLYLHLEWPADSWQNSFFNFSSSWQKLSLSWMTRWLLAKVIFQRLPLTIRILHKHNPWLRMIIRMTSVGTGVDRGVEGEWMTLVVLDPSDVLLVQLWCWKCC